MRGFLSSSRKWTGQSKKTKQQQQQKKKSKSFYSQKLFVLTQIAYILEFSISPRLIRKIKNSKNFFSLGITTKNK